MVTPSFVVIVSMFMSPGCCELALGFVNSAAAEGAAVVSRTAAPPSRTSRLETSDVKPSLTASLLRLFIVLVLRISDSLYSYRGYPHSARLNRFAVKCQQPDLIALRVEVSVVDSPTGG